MTEAWPADFKQTSQPAACTGAAISQEKRKVKENQAPKANSSKSFLQGRT